MSFEMLEGITLADAAFRAGGDSLEEMFISSARALMSVMLEDPSSIEEKQRVEFVLSDEEIDLLLFSFLQEFIFFKDSELLLLVPVGLSIDKRDKGFSLSCVAGGEKITRKRHKFRVDVKSVTYHRLGVERINQRWSATVVLDV